jgi:hypothetical protein
MNRTQVTSSNIRSVGYDADKRLLEIEFNSGAVYQYDEVPLEVHQGLMAAPSVGSFFASEIKPHYEAWKQ